MNKGGFSLNEKYLKKIFMQFVTVLIVLIVTGFLLRAEVNDLLNATLEKMMAKQTADLSIIAEERFSKELSELKLIAKYLETHTNAATEENLLQLLKADNENISVGLMRLDGTAIYGTALSHWDFLRFPTTYRGHEVVDYCNGKGLLFAVPVMHGGNVKAVIYRMYDESLLNELFGLAEYNYGSDVCLLIQERNGRIIIPYKNYGEAERNFFKDEAIMEGFKEIRNKLEKTRSASVYCESATGKFFLFATDLPQTNCTMIGYIPWTAVAGGIFKIYTLLLIVGMLMFIIFALVSAYLFVMRTKVEESDALREAKKAAEAASNAKSDFLANMSHEIRTPINAIIGMNEMILRESQNPDVISYAQNSAAASETLLSIINDILDFSKIESGKFSLSEGNYTLKDVIKSLVTMMKPRADKKNLLFKLTINPATENHLFGDLIRIRQILLNLLSNAVKYTNEGGIEFIAKSESVSDGKINLKFTVKDTGIGIHAEDLSKIFNDFERFDLEKNKNIEGTGLGLAITYRLVKLMNGNIDVESVYGKGSTFSVTIPQKVVDGEVIGVFDDESAAAHEKYQPAFISPTAEILVVDDNEMNLLVAVNLLKATKIKVDTALSGAICLKKLKERHYDLVFLDQMMPELDGIQTLQTARAMDGNLNKSVPIIALTANAISGAREKLIDAGFDDYLAKPIDVKVMERMLMKYLSPEKILSPVKKASEPEEKFINADMGLEYCAGMKDFYKEVLLKFSDLKDGKQKKLQELFAAQDWKNYTIQVHSLKSTSLSIGGEKTSEAAKKLEAAGKVLTSPESSDSDKQESEQFIKKNHAATMKLYDKLAAEAKKIAETL